MQLDVLCPTLVISAMATVNLAGNKLMAKGARAVADVLPQCTDLIALDVSNNDIPIAVLMEMESKKYGFGHLTIKK